MITDACLKTVNCCGKANTHPALRTRRIIGADGLLFLLLWKSGYIRSKIGLPLSGTFSFLVFCCVIAVLLVGIYASLRSGWHWHDQRSFLIGFLGHFLRLIPVPKALEFDISAGSAALIATMQPVLAALIAPYPLAERTHLYQWLGVVVSILSFFLMLHLIRTRNAVRVSSWQYFLPPITMLITWPAVGEARSLLKFVGLFIIAGGLLLIYRGEQASAHQTG